MQAEAPEEKRELVPEGNSKEVLGDSKIRTPKELKELYLKLREDDPYYRM